jgi:hypothetical protein
MVQLTKEIRIKKHGVQHIIQLMLWSLLLLPDLWVLEGPIFDKKSLLSFADVEVKLIHTMLSLLLFLRRSWTNLGCICSINLT